MKAREFQKDGFGYIAQDGNYKLRIESKDQDGFYRLVAINYQLENAEKIGKIDCETFRFKTLKEAKDFGEFYFKGKALNIRCFKMIYPKVNINELLEKKQNEA